MGTFSSFGLNQAYHERYEKLGDRLSDVGKTLDWDVFRPILESMYTNKSGNGGHPNVDVILMFKIQLLEVWYSLSDLAVEREIYDRLSFWHFLGCPDKIPDNSTIWLFRHWSIGLAWSFRDNFPDQETSGVDMLNLVIVLRSLAGVSEKMQLHDLERSQNGHLNNLFR